jgi:hypothetical protein
MLADGTLFRSGIVCGSAAVININSFSLASVNSFVNSHYLKVVTNFFGLVARLIALLKVFHLFVCPSGRGMAGAIFV